MESASRKQTEVVVPFKRAQQRRGDELAFLPAALEIVETPPSPVGRLTTTSSGRSGLRPASRTTQPSPC